MADGFDQRPYALSHMRAARRHACQFEARLSSTVIALLGLIAVGAVAVGNAGAEAGAATRNTPTRTGTPGEGDSLLKALSFGSSREPVAVTADALEFDYRSHVLTYKGDVVVTQGTMKLQSDTLTVALDDHAQNQVKEVVADGQVRLSQGARWATAAHAVFDQAHNTVVLSHNAEMHDGPNSVSGDRVIVYLDEARSVVEGRVKAVLVRPPEEDTPAAAGGKSEH
jgi:lipopolysaccharide export system protein LptA